VTGNPIVQQHDQIQNQQVLNCQQGFILPPAPFIPPQQQLVQQLPSGQIVERPLNVCGGGVQTIMSSPQPVLSPSNSIGLINPCPPGTQFIC
jgi:hypothetical protein